MAKKVQQLRPETVAQYAQAYIAQGWQVIPIWPIRDDGRCGCGNPDCDRAGKHVALETGVKEASSDIDKVSEWFENEQKFGIAIVTGKPSGISGLDIDMKDGKAGDLALDTIRGNNAMPSAPQVLTPTGGFHYYFKYNGDVRTAKEPYGANTAIDTRNDNGYLIAPPSLHAAGGVYKWADDTWRKELPEWPEWLKKPDDEKDKKKAKQKERFDPKNPAAVASLSHALRFVDFTDYDRWLQVGFILGRAFGWNEQGLAIYLEWASQAGSKFDHKKTTNTYLKDSRKVPKNPRTTASIYEWAQENEAYQPLETEVVREFQIVEDESDLPRMADEIASIAAHCESVFRRNGELVFLANDFSLYHHTPKTLQIELSRKIAYLSPGKTGRLVSKAVPEKLAQAVLERRGEGARSLVGFSPFPIFRGNWSLVTDTGYDETTGVWVNCPLALEIDADADNMAVLDDLLVDFPFASPIDRSVFMACLFTVGLRHLFDTAPMFGFSAYAAGSGKGLLTDIISMIWYGRRSVKSLWPAMEEELAKNIAADLRSGEMMIVYDNIDRGEKVHDPNLCAVLSAPEVRMRILGKSEKILLNTKATFMATGNDLTVTGDTARRCFTCIIDVRDASPERRTGFEHPDLMGYIRERRPAILAAAIGAILKWVTAGQPDSGFRKGSFEDWSRIIDGVLVANGCESLATYSNMGRATANDEAGEAETTWIGLLSETLFVEGDARFSTIEITERINSNSELRESFRSLYSQIVVVSRKYGSGAADSTRDVNTTTVGKLMNTIKGRWRKIDKRLYRITLYLDRISKQRRWALEEAKDPSK